MGDRAKLLKIGMWALVIFSILLFVVMIIVGHSNSFDFSQPDLSEPTFFQHEKHNDNLIYV